MGPALLYSLKLSALILSATSTDTNTYANAATRTLVARAMARHAEQDTTVRDYTAKIRYRVSFGVSRRKWGDPLPVAVEEQDAHLEWQLPNDVRVDMLGRRSATQVQGIDLASTFSHPWFVPRTLGDSLRIFGASQTPSRAAPHPLSADGPKYYRYVAGDSVSITVNGRKTTIIDITVTPKLAEGSFVAGKLWLDMSSGDVVRFTFRWVGTQLWSEPDGNTASDSTKAERDSKFVSKILELNADLEFSLQDKVHWMPYQQVISGKVSVPFGIDFAVPFEARTTFNDYNINSGTKVAFDAPFPRDTTPRGRNGGRIVAGGGGGGGGGRGRGAPPPRNATDSARPRPDSATLARFRQRGRNRTGYLAGGGRYEIHRPPADSMRLYNGWGDTLQLTDNESDRRRLQQAMSDLAHITEALPREMTGRPGIGLAWERVSDVLRYNRVEGTALSIGEHVPLPISFSDAYGTLRYGFGDERILARVALVRDAPSGRLIVAGGRDLADIDPFSQGISFGNSLRGIFTGHDDGAYLLAQGARMSYEWSSSAHTEMMWTVRAEDEQSVTSRARAFFPRIVGDDGYFPDNPAIRDGFAAGAGWSVDHSAPHSRWIVTTDALYAANRAAGRITADVRFPQLVHGWVSLRLKGGFAPGSDSVPQLALRAGGENTVRGYDFGVTTGDALWSTQLDISRPVRRAVKVVGFVDAGEAGDLSNFGAAPFLSGAGIGLSFLGGFIRTDLSHAITHAEGRGVRFDLVFSTVR